MPWSIPALSSISHYHSPLCHAHSGPQAFARAFPLPGMHLHFPSSLNSNPPPQFEMFPPSPPLLAQFHSLCSQSKWSIPYQHSFDCVLYSQYRAWHRNPKIRLRDQDIPFCLCSRKTRAIPHEHWWEQPWNQLPQQPHTWDTDTLRVCPSKGFWLPFWTVGQNGQALSSEKRWVVTKKEVTAMLTWLVKGRPHLFVSSVR